MAEDGGVVGVQRLGESTRVQKRLMHSFDRKRDDAKATESESFNTSCQLIA